MTETPLSELNLDADFPATSAAAREAMESDEISLLDILVILAERKRIVFRITAIFAILAVVVSLLLTPRYTATVILLPPQQGSAMGAMLASQLGGMAALAGGGLMLKNPNEMFVAMFKSQIVEDAMVRHFGLMQEYRKRYLSDARKDFERHASIHGDGKDGMIHISIEDRNPRRAAELANGYVEQFRTLSQHLAISEASQRRLFFEQEIEQAKTKLANSEEALKQTERTTGLIQLDNQARALIESAVALRAQITAREVQIRGMQTYAGSENAQLVQQQRELEGLRAQLAKLGGSEDSTGGELLLFKGRVPEASLEYTRKFRDVRYNEAVFEILARQFELAKLDEAKQGSLVQVVDPATPPDRKSFPKRGLIVICATFLGFFFAAFLALAQESLARTKKDPYAAERFAVLKRALAMRKRRTS